VSFIAFTGNLVHAQDTTDYFRQNCLNCHTIGGGPLTGPDLKNATERQDREWLIRFMQNPQAVIDSGDPYALKILRESRNVPMPVLPGMTRERAERLLDLIEAESQLEESQFKGVQISTAPFTAADVRAGRAIFQGVRPLEAGGTACIACHSINDIPADAQRGADLRLNAVSALGGGRLGPDLTNVYERLQGRKSLSAWLVAPATQTMQPIFKNHPLTGDEIHSLVAYFEATASQSPTDPSASRVTLLLTGLIGAAALVFVMDAIWRRRFHAVRQPLVERETAQPVSQT
jgi:mono/diheme cytochrome c family protein